MAGSTQSCQQLDISTTTSRYEAQQTLDLAPSASIHSIDRVARLTYPRLILEITMAVVVPRRLPNKQSERGGHSLCPALLLPRALRHYKQSTDLDATVADSVLDYMSLDTEQTGRRELPYRFSPAAYSHGAAMIEAAGCLAYLNYGGSIPNRSSHAVSYSL